MSGWSSACVVAVPDVYVAELLLAASDDGLPSWDDARTGVFRTTDASSVPGANTHNDISCIDGCSSAELAARIRSGDSAAFATVYRALQDRLWRFAMTLVADGDVAHELVQEVFVSLWTRRASLDVRDDLTVYLFGAVRRQAGKMHRHAGVVRRVHATILRTIQPDAQPSTGPAPAIGADRPDLLVEQNDLRTAVAEALGALDSRGRAALLLRWSEGRTYEEIGRILGISAMGAHKMVARGLERIRPLLRRFHDPAKS
jgi:RNA polymerase sigma-70 factor (ECF subfamily)